MNKNTLLVCRMILVAVFGITAQYTCFLAFESNFAAFLMTMSFLINYLAYGWLRQLSERAGIKR